MNRRSVLCIVAVAHLGLIAARPADAAALNLIFLDHPDIAAGTILTEYDAGLGKLTAVGQATSLDAPPAHAISGGMFDLWVAIDNAGVATAGSLGISGTIASLGFSSGTLLSGDFEAFGTGPSGPLEFRFMVTGGDAAGLFGGIGASVGVKLNGTGYGGSFGADFDNALFPGASVGIGTALVGVSSVPAPSAAALGLLGLVMCGALVSALRKGDEIVPV